MSGARQKKVYKPVRTGVFAHKMPVRWAEMSVQASRQMPARQSNLFLRNRCQPAAQRGGDGGGGGWVGWVEVAGVGTARQANCTRPPYGGNRETLSKESAIVR